MRGKNRREKVGFRDTLSARFRKRENAHMEMAHMYLYATDFENAAKITYMEKWPKPGREETVFSLPIYIQHPSLLILYWCNAMLELSSLLYWDVMMQAQDTTTF